MAIGTLLYLLCRSFLLHQHGAGIHSIWLTALSLSLITILSYLAGHFKHILFSVTGRRRPGELTINLVSILAGKMLFITTGFLVAWFSYSLLNFRQKTSWSGIPVEDVQTIEAVLLSDPVIINSDRWFCKASVFGVSSRQIQANARARAIIYGKGQSVDLGTGRKIIIAGSIRWTEKSDGYSLVINASEYTEKGWYSNYHRIRYRLMKTLQDRLFNLNLDSTILLSALLLGQKIDSGSPLIYRFRQTGCMHLLAISGFHVGLMALGIRSLIKPLAGFRVASVLSAMCSILYLMLVGIRPSLFRAVLMYQMYVFDSIRGIRSSAINYLCCAFMIQVAILPADAVSLSFKLSYAALFGILSLGQILSSLFSRYLPFKMSVILGAGLGAQILTLPFIIQHFGIWRPVGLIASPIITIFVSLLMISGGLFLFLGLIPGLLIDYLVKITQYSLNLFSWIPGLNLKLLTAWLITVLSVTVLSIIFWRIKYHKRNNSQPQFPLLNPCPLESAGSVSQ